MRSSVAVLALTLLLAAGCSSSAPAPNAPGATTVIPPERTDVRTPTPTTAAAFTEEQGKAIAETLKPLGIRLHFYGVTSGSVTIEADEALDAQGQLKGEIKAQLDKLAVPEMSLSFDDGNRPVNDVLLAQLGACRCFTSVMLHSCGEATDVGLAQLLKNDRLETVFIGGDSKMTPAGLGKLATLPRLKSLLLSNGLGPEFFSAISGHATLESFQCGDESVTDEGLSKISGLPALKSLDLSFTPITGAGLTFLKNCRMLKDLKLNTMDHLTDAAFAAIEGLPEVEMVMISGGFGGDLKLTDQSLKALATLPKLDLLTIRKGAAISDAGIAHLAGLKSLTVLHLNDCPALTDACFDSLAKLSALRGLELTGAPKVTDAGLAKLQPLSQLKGVDVSKTAVTKEGAMKLKDSMKLNFVRTE